MKVYVGVEDGAWYASDVGLLYLAHIFQKASVDLSVRVLTEECISSAWRVLAADATADGKVGPHFSVSVPVSATTTADLTLRALFVDTHGFHCLTHVQDLTLVLTDDLTLSGPDWFSRVTAAFAAIAEGSFATAEARHSMYGFGCVALTSSTSYDTSSLLLPASLVLHRLHWDIFDQHVLDASCSYSEAVDLIFQTYAHFGAARVVNTVNLISDSPQALTNGTIKVCITTICCAMLDTDTFKLSRAAATCLQYT
jgi:hypothetical protein